MTRVSRRLIVPVRVKKPSRWLAHRIPRTFMKALSTKAPGVTGPFRLVPLGMDSEVRAVRETIVGDRCVAYPQFALFLGFPEDSCDLAARPS